MSQEEIVRLIGVFQGRYLANKINPLIKYILIIENNGPKSGASLAHPHFQLFGFSNIQNSFVEEELYSCAHHLERVGRCPYCQMIEYELREGERLVYENDDFVAFVPFAPRAPFETVIFPKEHSAFFENLNEEQKANFADVIKKVLGKIHKGLGDVDYNSYIHTAPVCWPADKDGCRVTNFYHWHYAISPKITTYGGFEYGTGMIVITILPEEAAAFLRNQVI